MLANEGCNKLESYKVDDANKQYDFGNEFDKQ